MKPAPTTKGDPKLRASVQCDRRGNLGVVFLYVSLTFRERELQSLYKIVAGQINDPWVRASSTGIVVSQPKPGSLGGAAEREAVVDKLKQVRGITKTVLRNAGYAVR